MSIRGKSDDTIQVKKSEMLGIVYYEHNVKYENFHSINKNVFIHFHSPMIPLHCLQKHLSLFFSYQSINIKCF